MFFDSFGKYIIMNISVKKLMLIYLLNEFNLVFIIDPLSAKLALFVLSICKINLIAALKKKKTR